jgi:glyoxylate reductase/D-3-phosphoglycerate dehydrogenase
MHVQYFDIARLSEGEADRHNVKFRLLRELLKTSDIVSLHVPLNDSTRHMIGKEELELMKPAAIIVNTSRGPVIDEKALAAHLAAGKIFGAGLDVFDREPPSPDNPLLTLSNVITAPHMAGVTVESFDRMAVATAQNLLDVLDGKPNMDHVVNKEVFAHR